jgi:hypothetical protein
VARDKPMTDDWKLLLMGLSALGLLVWAIYAGRE